LTPAERARLLGKPEGELGIALGKVMNENNAQVIEAAYRRLGLQTGHSVLEIGFGNGHTVPLLMKQAETLNYVGIDISETMVAEATSFNQPLIDAGRAAFHFAAAGSLPCADASVDRAVAVNVIYFWPDPVHELSEIRRVLRPDGMSVIAATDAASAITGKRTNGWWFFVTDQETERSLRSIRRDYVDAMSVDADDDDEGDEDEIHHPHGYGVCVRVRNIEFRRAGDLLSTADGQLSP